MSDLPLDLNAACSENIKLVHYPVIVGDYK